VVIDTSIINVYNELGSSCGPDSSGVWSKRL